MNAYMHLCAWLPDLVLVGDDVSCLLSGFHWWAGTTGATDSSKQIFHRIMISRGATLNDVMLACHMSHLLVLDWSTSLVDASFPFTLALGMEVSQWGAPDSILHLASNDYLL